MLLLELLRAAVQRRDFLGVLSGAAVAWPLEARAQRSAKLPTIGILGTDVSLWGPRTAVLVQRLRELGWVDGRTVAIEYRWSEGHPERAGEIAAEFVRLKVDVIVTNGPAVDIVKRKTSVIPIVFAIANDPVGGGLVASLARPGGNVTGLSNQSPELAGKRLELLREVVPQLHRLAMIGNVGYPSAVLEMGEIKETASRFGIEVAPMEIRRAEDIVPVFAAQVPADALYVVEDAVVVSNRTRIITLALSARMPTIFQQRDLVQDGGLMSYGPNFTDLFRRAAEIVDKILRGAKPADIPVEQPTKFELVINLITAKALALSIPRGFLMRADEVIE
jgi:putative tryptophan/tyrosine transport system substrate-binding protein